MKDVSVIVPCFNAAATLEKTVGSCIRQLEYLKEIIIVDDFSTDTSWQVITGLQAKYPDLIVAVRNEKKGGNNARNLGFSLSTGKYIQWLDADDLLLGGKLQAQCRHFEENPDTDIIYSDWRLEIYNEHDHLIATEEKWGKPYDDYLMELLRDNWQPPVSYLVRRTTALHLYKLLAWNPETKAAQDREYFTTAALQGATFRYVKGMFSVYIRQHKPSLSRSLHMRDKAKIIVGLLTAFRSIIQKRQLPEAKAYFKVIDTQLLYYAAVFGTQRFKFRFSDIHWSMINGKRSRLKSFLMVLLS